MNYLVCEDCDQKYCGWATSEFCQKCGGKLEKVTWEEFYSEKAVIRRGGLKDDSSRYL